MSNRHPLLLITAVAVGAATSGTGVAVASVGTGVQAAPVRPAAAVAPGTTVRLSWWVQNTGSVTTAYRLTAVAPTATQRERVLPAAWITLPAAVDLRPGAHTLVPVRLAINRSARGGTYRAYLLATATSARQHGGAAVGTAAATEVDADVRTGTDTHVPRSLLAVPAAVAAGLLALIRRRTTRRRTR